MRFNKTVLALAVATALGSGSALAVVNMDGLGGGPIFFANEIAVSSGGTTIDTVTPAALTQVATKIGVGIPLPAVTSSLFARFELDNGAKFALNPTLDIATAAGAAFNCTTGGAAATTCVFVGGGASASFAVFQITATAAGAAIPADSVLTLTTTGTGVTVVNTSPVAVRYRLYATQGNAQDAVGTPSKDVAAAYLAFTDSYTLATNTAVSTADIAAKTLLPTPASFVKFVNGLSTASLGSYTLRLTTPNVGATATYTAGGVAVASLGVILDPTSKLSVTGSFDARAATNGVNISSSCPGGTAVSSVTDTQADIPLSFVSSITATTPAQTVCYTVTGTKAINISDYNIALTAVPKPGYSITRALGPMLMGTVVHNGAELQAPLAQIPTGWTARIALTNTGTVARNFSTRVLSESTSSGTDVSTATLTPAAAGSIPAGKIVVLSVPDMISVVPIDPASPAKRATVIVDVTAPNNEIQAVYQLISPSGNPTNMAMIRPGTN